MRVAIQVSYTLTKIFHVEAESIEEAERIFARGADDDLILMDTIEGDDVCVETLGIVGGKE